MHDYLLFRLNIRRMLIVINMFCHELVDKNAIERADLKSSEIVKLDFSSKYESLDYGVTFELRDLSKIEYGIQVFARAWKNGKQLGFGTDGTVEWERFKIYNPPVLVPDVNGGVIRTWIDKDTGEEKQQKYREDLVEALKLSIAHTIKLVGKEDENKIIHGKQGNTTTTFYPDPDPETTTVDGYVGHIYGVGAGQIWATIRAAAGSEFNDTRTTNSIAASALADTGADNWREIIRSIFLFDTSSIPDTDTVDSATFSIYVPSVTDTASQSISLCSSAPASNMGLANGDYATLGTTKFATDQTIASLTTSAYNDFALNASGLANISKIGVSKFGMRLTSDVDNLAPTWGSGIEPRVNCHCADTAGTIQDPKLTITHSSGAIESTRSPSGGVAYGNPMMH